jgi:hypothetical protein
MSENISAVEMHGCIVCARTFKVLAMYTPEGRLVGCTVTGGPDGHCVPGERQPLVACDTHTAEDIEAAHARWQSRNGAELDDEQEDEKGEHQI